MGSIYSPFSPHREPSALSNPPLEVRLDGTPRTLLDPTTKPTPTGAQRPVRVYPLSDIADLHAQEALIIKDLLCVLLGHEGDYIRYSERYVPSSPNARVEGPDYKIAKHIDLGLKDITKRVSRYGKMYVALNAFQEQYDKAAYGKVNQRLCFELREFLGGTHHPMVCLLESEFNSPASALNLIQVGQLCEETIAVGLTHLYEIITTIHHENLTRHQHRQTPSSDLLASIKHDLRDLDSLELLSDLTPSPHVTGQMTLRVTQTCLEVNQADETSFRFLTTLFDRISEPYLAMLNEWLRMGTITDPFLEFLIKEVEPPASITAKNSGRYWESKFVMRKEQDSLGNDIMMNQFRDKRVQLRILQIGRYLNVVRCCGIDVTSLDTFSSAGTHLPDTSSGRNRSGEGMVPPFRGVSSFCSTASGFRQGRVSTADFDIRLEAAYRRANRLIVLLYAQGYDLMGLLLFMKRFWFHQQQQALGTDAFCRLSLRELRKPASSASLSRLRRHFQAHITRTTTTSTAIEGVLRELPVLSFTTDSFFTHLLEILAIRPSFGDMDQGPYGDSLKFLLQRSLESNTHRADDTMMSGSGPSEEYALFNLSVEMQVPFPLNLVFKEDMLACFGLVSRTLLMTRFLLLLHESAWRELNTPVWRSKRFSPVVKKWILRVRVFHGMLQSFLVEYQYYLTHDVVEAEWGGVERKVAKQCASLVLGSGAPPSSAPDGSSAPPFGTATGSVSSPFASLAPALDFHSMVEDIQSCLNAIMKGSFLVNKELVEVLHHLLLLILQFDQFALSMSKTLIHLDEELFAEHYGRDPSRVFDPSKNPERIEKMNAYLNRVWGLWNEQMDNYIEGLAYLGAQENDCFLRLCQRLRPR